MITHASFQSANCKVQNKWNKQAGKYAPETIKVKERTTREIGAANYIQLTRSSAQGNCSAKSLAGNVANSSLSSLSAAIRRGGGMGGSCGRSGRGRGSCRGEEGSGSGEGGMGTLPCTALPHGSSPWRDFAQLVNAPAKWHWGRTADPAGDAVMLNLTRMCGCARWVIHNGRRGAVRFWSSLTQLHVWLIRRGCCGRRRISCAAWCWSPWVWLPYGTWG